MPSRYNEEFDKKDYDKLIHKKDMYEKKIVNINKKIVKLTVNNQMLHNKTNKILAERRVLHKTKTEIAKTLNKKKEIEQKKVQSDKNDILVKIEEYKEKMKIYGKIIENIKNNLKKFDANNKRSMSSLPRMRRITSQMSRYVGKKNYIEDNNSSRSSNISKDSIGHVEIDLNEDEEAALLLELAEMEQDIKKGANIKKIKKSKKNKK